MKNTVGLLLPRSAFYPGMNFDMLEGIRAGLAAEGCAAPQFLAENIGMAANEDTIYAHCERMLIDGAQVVVGYVTPMTALKLQPLFAAAGALFIVLDSGYHFLPGEKKLSNIVFLSLQSALCCRMVAQKALDRGYRSFSFATSFYDAGYRSAYTIARTIEAGGGQVVFNHVTALKRKDFTLEPLMQFLLQEPGHALVASYCGDMATDFFGHIGQQSLAAGSLFGGPFMGDEVWLQQSPYPGCDVTVCVPWSRQLRNKSNRFLQQSLDAKGREANYFSLLGYEAGQLLSIVMTDGSFGADAAQLLCSLVFESPRGILHIDADTHQSVAAVYEARIVEHPGTGRCDLSTPVALPNTQQQWELLQEDIAAFSGMTNNWLNAYPCIES